MYAHIYSIYNSQSETRFEVNGVVWVYSGQFVVYILFVLNLYINT